MFLWKRNVTPTIKKTHLSVIWSHLFPCYNATSNNTRGSWLILNVGGPRRHKIQLVKKSTHHKSRPVNQLICQEVNLSANQIVKKSTRQKTTPQQVNPYKNQPVNKTTCHQINPLKSHCQDALSFRGFLDCVSKYDTSTFTLRAHLDGIRHKLTVLLSFTAYV